MPLVGSRDMLYRAMAEGYAVAAFNIACLDLINPIVEAAEAESAPIMLAVAPRHLELNKIHVISAAAKAAARAARVPIALHLDHGASYEMNVACLQAGFTSLMFDGSSRPYEENVRITSQIVDLGHAVGIGVEAELGRVLRAANAPTAADVKAMMTDPGEARAFVDATGVDYLAVAVGTVHNMIKATAEVDLPRIAAIRERVRVPLVLHGGSGVPDDVIARAVANGIAKFNVATELNKQLRLGMEKAYADMPVDVAPPTLFPPAMALVRETARHKIRLFGSTGKA
ncbi:MAG: class II fructose-bisphosphate aldolase [Chloroflexota bacterium]